MGENKFDATFRDHQNKLGVALGIYSRGKIQYTKGYGFANLDDVMKGVSWDSNYDNTGLWGDFNELPQYLFRDELQNNQ